MISEQIKSEIAKQVDEQFKDLKKSLEIFSLPLVSQYKVITFSGVASGIDLTPGNANTNAEMAGKILIIKSIRLIPYYAHDGLDFNIGGNTEPVWNNTRIERIFDFITVGTDIRVFLNEVPLSMFQENDYPLDLFVDNIFYKYPYPFINMRVQVNGRTVEDITTGAAATPNVRVVIECYLI